MIRVNGWKQTFQVELTAWAEVVQQISLGQAVGAAAAILVAYILERVLERWWDRWVKRTFPEEQWLLRVDNWLRWLMGIAAVVVAASLLGFGLIDLITGILGQSLKIGTTTTNVFSILLSVFILWLTWNISGLIQRQGLSRYYDRHSIDPGVRFALNRLLHYALVAFGGFIVLQTLGLDLSALAVLGGLVGVGVGFGLQNIISNFISGIILLFERPVKAGDRIELEDIDLVGDVVTINMRSTHVRTPSNEMIIVPNEYFIKESVHNISFDDPKVRMNVSIGVGYNSDIHHVRQLLFQVAAANDTVLTEPEPEVVLREFGDSAIVFDLMVWVPKPIGRFRIRSQLNFAIWDTLTDAGVEIPFPQRDIHLRSGFAGDGEVSQALND